MSCFTPHTHPRPGRGSRDPGLEPKWLLLLLLLSAVRLLLVLLVMLQAWQLSVFPAPVIIINARETRLLRKAVAPALGKVRHALRQLPAKASYVVPGVDAGADRFES